MLCCVGVWVNLSMCLTSWSWFAWLHSPLVRGEEVVKNNITWTTLWMNAESWTLNTEHWTLNAERWTLNAERWTLNTEHWTLNAERWTLNTEHWTLNAERWTPDDQPLTLNPQPRRVMWPGVDRNFEAWGCQEDCDESETGSTENTTKIY